MTDERKNRFTGDEVAQMQAETFAKQIRAAMCADVVVISIAARGDGVDWDRMTVCALSPEVSANPSEVIQTATLSAAALIRGLMQPGTMLTITLPDGKSMELVAGREVSELITS